MSTWLNNLMVYNNGKLQKIAAGDTVQLQSADTTKTIEFNSATGAVEAFSFSAEDVDTTTLTVTGNALVEGNLTVQGNIVSGGAYNVSIGDSFLALNASNTGTASKSGGTVVSMRSTMPAIAIASAFVAGVASPASAPTITVDDAYGILADNIIQVSGTDDAKNDGLYVVASVSGSGPYVLTLKGIGSTAISGQVPFVNNNLVTQTGQTASVVPAYVGVIATSTGADSGGSGGLVGNGGSTLAPEGVPCYGSGSFDADFIDSWVSLQPAAAQTLQQAYNAGTEIQMTAALGAFQVIPATGENVSFSIVGNVQDGQIGVDSGKLTVGSANGSVVLSGKTVLPVATVVTDNAANALTARTLVYLDNTGAFVAASSAVACIPVGTIYDANTVASVPGTIIRALGKAGSSWASGDTLWMSSEAGTVDSVAPTSGRIFIVGIAAAAYDNSTDTYADVRFQPHYVADI